MSAYLSKPARFYDVNGAEQIIFQAGVHVTRQLSAVEYLLADGSSEAFAILKKALYLVTRPASEHLTGASIDGRRPLGGELAGAAARALCEFPGNEGTEFLLKILGSEAEPVVVRDCAAYGLGGNTSSATFEALTSMLSHSSASLRFAAVCALDESLSNLNGLASSRRESMAKRGICQAIEALAQLATSKTNQDLSSELACKVLVRHMIPSAEEVVMEAASQSGDERRALRAIEILSNFLSPASIKVFVAILRDRNRSVAEYDRVADILGSVSDKSITKAATEIINEPLLLELGRALFSAHRVSHVRARRRAAQTLLEEKQSPGKPAQPRAT